MGTRFNPAPGWPPVPEGYVPPPGWQPDPAWPPAPEGWQLWVDDGLPSGPGGSLAPPVAGWGQPAGQPGWGQPPGQAAWGQPAGQAGGTSGQAVASLVLGIAGFTLLTAALSILFGILALGNIRRQNLRGRGLAICGIVLSGLWVVLIVALVAVGIAAGGGSSAAKGPAPAAVAPGGRSVDVFSLVTGDCFDNPAASGSGTQSVINVEQTPCTVRHNAQIYATFKLAGGMLSYPGSARTQNLAANGCNARATASLDKAKITSSMTIRFLFPVQSSWLAGRRSVSCIVVNSTTSLTTSVLSTPAS
jgi:hypothetical protein